jgi:hypothetical protein
VYKGNLFGKILNKCVCKLKNKWIIKIKCVQILIKVALFVLVIHTGSKFCIISKLNHGSYDFSTIEWVLGFHGMLKLNHNLCNYRLRSENNHGYNT